MSAISGVPGGSQPGSHIVAQAQTAAVAAAKVTVRDSDGDYDGTAPGQIDAKDFGKGVNIDKRA